MTKADNKVFSGASLQYHVLCNGSFELCLLNDQEIFLTGREKEEGE